MKTPPRLRRRNDKARMKAKARRLYPHDPNGCLADHLASCSCWACGHQRKHFGPPAQERRQLLGARA